MDRSPPSLLYICKMPSGSVEAVDNFYLPQLAEATTNFSPPTHRVPPARGFSTRTNI